MSVLSQSDAIEALRKSYGGSDSTAPSFLRPQYVRHNSFSKAQDFGPRDNLNAVVSGLVGGEVGAATLFFKVQLNSPADVRIVKGSINPKTDQYIAVGIADGDRRPLPLDELGFLSANDVHNTDDDESLARSPAGTYYFTVSSSQWQALPFSVGLLVISYKEVSGFLSGSGDVTGRLAMAKLEGAVLGSDATSAAIPVPATIERLDGAAGGTAPLAGELAILSGAITGTMTPYGYLMQTHRLEAAASGTAPVTGTLTVTTPGGGYGY